VVRKSFELHELYKNTDIVMDEGEGEGEGRRTMEEICKSSAANFASICLGMSHSLYIK
jgi:hypothetical protein